MHNGLKANVAAVYDEGDTLEPGGVTFDKENPYWNNLPEDFALAGSMDEEPGSLAEALAGKNGDDWKAGWDKEIGRLEGYNTWKLVHPPEGVSILPCNEVFKTKCGPNNEVVERRVRIGAGGHRQKKGVDYTESFHGAAKTPLTHVVLAHAAKHDWEIHQVDVKSAYLNAKLDHPVYMKAPRGYLKTGQEGMVCMLMKCLYGLVQAGREWYLEMSRTIVTKMGFSWSGVNHSVFFWKLRSGEHVIVAVATDDMAVTGNSISAVNHFKAEISSHYDITDLGELHWFLGFEVKRDRAARTISINQRAYIEGMAKKFGLTDTKPVQVPMLPGEILTKDQCPSTPPQLAAMQGVPYGEMIGHILWPVMISRPDALFMVGILAQFIQNPGPAHFKALKRGILYLYTTCDLWLTFGGENAELIGYTDADWAS